MIEKLLELPGGTRERLARLTRNEWDSVDALWACPGKMMPTPDPWQEEVLCDIKSNWLLNASRQSGKTEVVAAKVAWEAVTCGSFVLVISASEAQAFEFHARTMEAYHHRPLVQPAEDPTKSQLRLVNGGRVLCLPNNERTVRVYSKVDLLVIDEASRVPDTLFGAVRPMLAVSGGRTICLSTPFGKRGFFWKEWSEGRRWRRKEVPWQKCPRIKPAFIEDERLMHGDSWVKQEYECNFNEVTGAMFDVEAMRRLIDPSLGAVEWW